MFVFFNVKSPVFFFEFYSDVNIYINIIRIIFIILYITITKFTKAINKFPVRSTMVRIPMLYFFPTL